MHASDTREVRADNESVIRHDMTANEMGRVNFNIILIGNMHQSNSTGLHI